MWDPEGGGGLTHQVGSTGARGLILIAAVMAAVIEGFFRTLAPATGDEAFR